MAEQEQPIYSPFFGVMGATSAMVFSAMGAAVNALPGGEIVAAMDRGLLDAAEFKQKNDFLFGSTTQ